MAKNPTVNPPHKPQSALRGKSQSKSKPKLGQHFLAAASYADQIVDALGDISGSIVLEIGPGRGALTAQLAAKAERLIVIELDRMLAAQLRLQYAQQQHRIEVVEGDVTAIDFSSLLGPRVGSLADRQAIELRKVKVIGNLPYYVTSDILLKLFHYHSLFSDIVIMVQREVADRLAAKPKSRDYGMLSVTAQLYAYVEKLFDVPPGAFAPPPKVWSSVLRLRIAPRDRELGIDAEEFQKFLREVFAQKRKTLWNNLKHDYAEEAVKQAFKEAGILPTARAEELSLEKLARIYRELKSGQE